MPPTNTHSPAPWSPVWATGEVLMVTDADGKAVAAVDGGPHQDANAAAIALVPEMILSIRSGDFAPARAALAAAGLA